MPRHSHIVRTLNMVIFIHVFFQFQKNRPVRPPVRTSVPAGARFVVYRVPRVVAIVLPVNSSGTQAVIIGKNPCPRDRTNINAWLIEYNGERSVCTRVWAFDATRGGNVFVVGVVSDRRISHFHQRGHPSVALSYMYTVVCIELHTFSYRHRT